MHMHINTMQLSCDEDNSHYRSIRVLWHFPGLLLPASDANALVLVMRTLEAVQTLESALRENRACAKIESVESHKSIFAQKGPGCGRFSCGLCMRENRAPEHTRKSSGSIIQLHENRPVFSHAELRSAEGTNPYSRHTTRGATRRASGAAQRSRSNSAVS